MQCNGEKERWEKGRVDKTNEMECIGQAED